MTQFVSKHIIIFIPIITIDFDEKKFDIDEYENRLKKFEEYLNTREEKL